MNPSMKKEQGITSLSYDLKIIETEILTFKRIASESIHEIGLRLIHVKNNDLSYGCWEEWLQKIGIHKRVAQMMMKVSRELSEEETRTSSCSGLDALYLIATIPDEERSRPHQIQSTGEIKELYEMTVRELREVKKTLKDSETAQILAEKDAEILRNTLESIEDQEPEVITKTEYVEIKDEAADEKLRKYEELFGDISIYEHGARRVSNRTEVMSSIQMFSHDTRNLLKKYAYFEQYSREIREMPDGVKQEFKSTLEAINNFVVDMADSLGINNSNIIDAEIIEN